MPASSVLLGAVVALLLSAKVATTAVLLRRDSATRLYSVSGRRLWWVTKRTPVVAVPCMIAIAAMHGRRDEVAIYAALMLFVIVVWREESGPWKIRRHRAALIPRS